MAYDKEEIYKEVIKAIRDNKLKHFLHIENFVVPDIKTLKEWKWQIGESTECANIKRELSKNKISAKILMIDKWINSDNATLQIAAYKLLGTEEERKNLSSSYIDHTSDGKELKGITIKWGENKIDV